jgi:hypothetical protein
MQGEIDLREQKLISPELLTGVYNSSVNYAINLIGNKKSRELLQSSYDIILPYFHSLKNFSVDTNGQLEVKVGEISESELLAFTIWIQQFVRELKNFVVGISKLDIHTLTGEISDELEQIGFYEYFQQAAELKY